MFDYNSTVHCFDQRPCFGRGKESHNCRILSSTYPPDACPFCKEEREKTNGKSYAYVDMDFGYVKKYGRKRKLV